MSKPSELKVPITSIDNAFINVPLSVQTHKQYKFNGDAINSIDDVKDLINGLNIIIDNWHWLYSAIPKKFLKEVECDNK